MTRLRRLLPAFLVVLCFGMTAAADEVWQTLPPTPTRPAAERKARRRSTASSSTMPCTAPGEPVILLHGGLGNADYWGDLIPALATHYQVIVMDSRGHGRSTRDAQPYGYDLMASDVLGADGLSQDRQGRHRRLERRRRSSASTSR